MRPVHTLSVSQLQMLPPLNNAANVKPISLGVKQQQQQAWRFQASGGINPSDSGRGDRQVINTCFEQEIKKNTKKGDFTGSERSESEETREGQGGVGVEGVGGGANTGLNKDERQ